MTFTPREDRYRSKYQGLLNRHPDESLETVEGISNLIDELTQFIDEATTQTESVYFAKKNRDKFMRRRKYYQSLGEDTNTQDNTQDNPQDITQAFCYIEGFLNGVMKAYGEDQRCRDSLDTLWKFIEANQYDIVVNTPYMDMEQFAQEWSQK